MHVDFHILHLKAAMRKTLSSTDSFFFFLRKHIKQVLKFIGTNLLVLEIQSRTSRTSRTCIYVHTLVKRLSCKMIID